MNTKSKRKFKKMKFFKEENEKNYKKSGLMLSLKRKNGNR